MTKLVLALLVVASAYAQSTQAAKHFLIRIQPARATFVDDMTKEEQKIMGVHFNYLKRLADEGKVILAGPSINGPKTFGIIVVSVGDEAEARAILEGDPSYKAGIQKGEVLPFQLSILREAKPTAKVAP